MSGRRLKVGDIVTIKSDCAFIGKVLLDPREGKRLVFVAPSQWGGVPATEDGIIGLDMSNLEVVGRARKWVSRMLLVLQMLREQS